ncbi:MAG: sulfatase-like hydrolase/transferase [Bacteroidota bacterium]
MNNKSILLLPFLLIAYYFTHYCLELYYFIEPIRSVKQFLLYVIVTAVLFFAGRRLSKNEQRFTLAFITVLFVFLFFGAVIDTFVSVGNMGSLATVGAGSILAFLILCTTIIFICYRLSEGLVKKLLTFWALYFLILLVYDTGIFFLFNKAEKKYVVSSSETRKFTNAEKPSVFFLLFDMYPSDIVLKKYLGYDNAAMDTFLKRKGFYVAGNAHSLYQETYYSLPSTLSLQSLSYIGDSSLEDYQKKLLALKNIQHTVVPAVFENSGYVFRNYSVFDLQGKKSPLQFNLNYHIDNVLTASTLFNRWYNGFEPDFFLAAHDVDPGFLKTSWSKNIKTDLAYLDESFNHLLDSFPALRQPSFNYFHFMMPHPPLIYDSSGKENSIKDMYAYNGFERSNKNFTSCIGYANRQMERMVNKIFEKAGRNTVIIIQGDHGYREFPGRFPDAVRNGAFNAVYLPSANYSGFTDSISVLQTFRQVLQTQFGFPVGK